MTLLQWSVPAALLLFGIGVLLRWKLRVLRWALIPSSVVGGIVGLVVLQVALHRAASPEGIWIQLTVWGSLITSSLRQWPGILIAVVFAGLLLEKPNRPVRSALRGALQNGIMVWIIVLGQVAIGLTAAWVLILPFHDVPAAFGQLIEAGFAGGHGTAAALGAIYVEVLEFEPGLDLGMFMATIGLVYSVLSGLVLVNIGVRRGWTRATRDEIERGPGVDDRGDDADDTPRERSSPGHRIARFLLQIVVLAAAYGLGWAMQRAFVSGAQRLPGETGEVLERVPLFLFTLLGGLALRQIMTLARIDGLLDGRMLKWLVALAMEFLIISAIATLRIEAVVTYAWPLTVLLLLGFAWTAFCLLVLARRLLPRAYWFELGILNYGMSTGTTAQGMMLLQIVDRDLESGAAEDYALAAPLSAPFVGGGLITLTLPLILERAGLPIVVVVLAVAVVGLVFAGAALRGKTGANGGPGGPNGPQ